jgi:hypothetical protein
MIEKIIIGVIVFAALAFVARGAFRRLCGKGGCAGCPSGDCPFRKRGRK